MQNKRSIILIDGSNLYFKLKSLKLHNLLNFDFAAFSNSLSKDDKLISTTYYVGAVKTDGTEKTQKSFDNQRKLLDNLKKSNIKYSLGYLLKTDGKVHEKGVDVNIAVDILIATYENLADKIILVSSDTDLEPAIKQAQKKGVSVEYIGFKHSPSKAMQRFCKHYRLFGKKEMQKFIAE